MATGWDVISGAASADSYQNPYSYPQAPPSTASTGTSTERNNLLAFYGDVDAANANTAQGTDMSWLGGATGGGNLYSAMDAAGYGPSANTYGGFDAAGYNAAMTANGGLEPAPASGPSGTTNSQNYVPPPTTNTGGTTNGGSTGGGTGSGGATGGTGGTGGGSTGTGGGGSTGGGTGTGGTGSGSGSTGGGTSPGNNGTEGAYGLADVPATQVVADRNAALSQTQMTDAMTAEQRLAAMTSKDSPLMQRAMLAGLQFAQKRGLSNSSLAAQAQQAAVIDAAQPFALQDANTAATIGLSNTDAANKNSQFNAELGTNIDMTNAKALNMRGDAAFLSNLQRQEMALGDTLQRRQMELQNSYDMAMQTLKGEQSVQLMNIEANYRQLLQSSASASTLFTGFMQTVGDIMSNTELSSTAAKNALDSVLLQLNNGLAMLSSFTTIDLTEYGGAAANDSGNLTTTNGLGEGNYNIAV